jgi:hypothetical protein
MPKSIVDDLKAELGHKRSAVKECEEALARERAAAEEYVQKKVARAEENLQKAKEEVERCVSEVAQVLGLPDATLARKTKQRLRRVRQLLAEHKTPEQIAGETGEPLELVKEDVARVSKSTGKSGPAKRVWTRTKVWDLLSAGRTHEETAEELGISVDEVDAHVEKLRSLGRLTVGEPAPKRLADASPTEEARARRTILPAGPSQPPPTFAGDEVADLRREVARQQAGSPAKAARLLAAPANGHGHEVVVDRMGDGTTQSDSTGHVHKVYRFVVSLAAGHQHGLRVTPGAGRV